MTHNMVNRFLSLRTRASLAIISRVQFDLHLTCLVLGQSVQPHKSCDKQMTLAIRAALHMPSTERRMETNQSFFTVFSRPG